jgi:hypothetical protein
MVYNKKTKMIKYLTPRSWEEILLSLEDVPPEEKLIELNYYDIFNDEESLRKYVYSLYIIFQMIGIAGILITV